MVVRRPLALCLLWLPTLAALRAGGGHAAPSARLAPARARVAVPRCCICINCRWVDRCKTYHWVETQHEQPHVTEAPDFDPPDPSVQVFVRSEDDPDEIAVSGGGKLLTTEFDVFACESFVEDAGKWLRLMPDADYLPP